MAKVWSGTAPDKCDICNRPIITEFVDGKTRMGPWGNMCSTCHWTHGVGLGIGKGQRYVKQNGKWMKEEDI